MSTPNHADGPPSFQTHGQVKLDAETLAALAAALVEVQTPAGALLDAEGAAKLLNVPATWLLAEARHSRVPHRRLGRYVRFEREELLAWSEGHSKGPRVRTGLRPVSRDGQPR